MHMFLNSWKARFFGLAIVAGAALVSARPASAATIIDAFNSPAYSGPIQVDPGAPNISVTQSGLSNVIGGERVVELNLVSGVDEMRAKINYTYRPGVATISSDDEVIGTFTFKYGYNSDLNADLSGSNAFTMDFSGADHPGASLFLTVTSGSNSSSASVAIPVGSSHLVIPFSAFSGINFADVDKLAYTIQGVASFDATIDSFATAVPLPSAAWAGLGLLGALGVNRVRKARNA